MDGDLAVVDGYKTLCGDSSPTLLPMIEGFGDHQGTADFSADARVQRGRLTIGVRSIASRPIVD